MNKFTGNNARKNKDFVVNIISPAYNEGENLEPLFEELKSSLSEYNYQWHWLIIDDHSSDKTFDVSRILARKNKNIDVIRFSRNFGSHAALMCGLEFSKGDCIVGLAADLQDPPNLIPEMVEKWKEGSDVVWAAREERMGISNSTKFFSRLYYLLMRNVAGLKNIPADGADFFLIDRKVRDAILSFPEHNFSVLSLLSWIGFNQTYIRYNKRARLSGQSGWSLKKKIKMAVDSLTSFSFLPIRLFSVLGLIISFLSFMYMLVVIILGIRGRSPEGWPTLMAAMLFIGGVQILMLGILGEYIWRILDESRNRPRYIIEKTSNSFDKI